MNSELPSKSIDKLRQLAVRLIDQRECKQLIQPLGSGEGFWFGGGNFIQMNDGNIFVCGRYRNHGDARTGVGAGERGLKFSVFQVSENLESASEVYALSKSELSFDSEVVSIEGGCLVNSVDGHGVEAIISTEKKKAYPKEFINFQKPGTGVWSIDLLKGPSGITSLTTEKATVIANSEEPNTLHVKDPVVFRIKPDQTELIYCHHPFSWSSSNTGLRRRLKEEEEFQVIEENVLPRGNSWDVACSRLTERLSVPKIGEFSELPDLSLYFYDGAECLRSLEQNKEAAHRPRGYSCEELGGLAWGWDDEFPKMQKITHHFPLFISPYGTGCSRYVSAIHLQDGSILAGWQQSQKDLSQPLVVNHLSANSVKAILN